MYQNNIMDIDNLKNCTGCGVCEAICPNNAIKIKLNNEGFYNPILNNKECISCGLCKKICYRFEKNFLDTKKGKIKAYSAINKNTTLLKACSSGGISEEIMKYCINQGYIVVGVEYDYSNNNARTTTCNNINLIEKYRGSKYIQSYTVAALKQVIKNKNKKFAIFGTPCQIYAIRKYIKMYRLENILLIDFFCHGVPTLFLWKSYINKYNLPLKKIKFRTKDYGWHNYSLRIIDRNGEEFLSSKINDKFYDLFFSKLCFNTACYDCKTRSTVAYADIRLGDW